MIVAKTKAELIQEVAARAEITKVEAEIALNTVRDAITDTLKELGRVAFDGVGVFTLIRRAARRGRNPKTGETIQIPAKEAVKFRPAASLKEAVNA